MMERDKHYLSLLVRPIRVCAEYRPKLGRGGRTGIELEEFQQIYRSDPFYNWFGLHNPLMYAAHRAAGGMTSVYRQIGIGCEHLFREILQDQLGLNPSQSSWSYVTEGANKKTRRLSLDGRIDLSDVMDKRKRNRICTWLRSCAKALGLDPEIAPDHEGSCV